MNHELLIKPALDAWNSHVSRVDTLLNTLTDEQLQSEIAPGRNRGTYLLGHLAAVHDRMLPLLNLGSRLHAELDEAFITNADKVSKDIPSAADLRAYWKEVNDTLAKKFSAMQPADWFQKHTSVSDEDFAKEPHRNKFAVLVSRAAHLSYHFGQMVLLKK